MFRKDLSRALPFLSSMNDTPTTPPDSTLKSTEDTDHLERSTKKIKSDHLEPLYSVETSLMESENLEQLDTPEIALMETTIDPAMKDSEGSPLNRFTDQPVQKAIPFRDAVMKSRAKEDIEK